MEVWRKWEVRVVDDNSQYHYVDFATKEPAICFCKAMVRMGATEVECRKDDRERTTAFKSPKPVTSS